MHRILLALAVVLSSWLVAPVNVRAQDSAENDRAIAAYDKALGDNPGDANTYHGRGIAWHNKGEYDRAIADYSQALAINPNLAEAYNNRGLAWAKKGDYNRAINDYKQALAIDPNLVDAHLNRGAAWYAKGKFGKAIADDTLALKADPKNADALFNRANAWNAKGEYDKAIADYDQALVINPDDAEALNGLAWLYATSPNANDRNGKKAFDSASKAVQIDGGKAPGFLDTLAAAYAETGDFEAARQWEAKAIELAAADKAISDTDKEAMQEHSERFKRAKPFREGPPAPKSTQITPEEQNRHDELVRAARDRGEEAIARQLHAWWPKATHDERAAYYNDNATAKLPEQSADEQREFDELLKAARESGREAIVRQLHAWWPVANATERAEYYKTNKPNRVGAANK